ncbi:MAG: helix-turn-helix domain-containing protein [Thermoleophilaceae bacterium]
MSLAASRWMWEESLQKGNSLLVGHALADHADPDGAAWPSVKTLAKKTRLKPRAVQNHLRTLREVGEIVVDQQGGRGDGDSTRYLLHRLDPTGREIRAVARPAPPSPQTARTVRSRRGGADDAARDADDSGAPVCTPQPTIAEEGLRLSRLFAQGLIAAGHKAPEARFDAESPEWLDEMELLVVEQLADPERLDRLAEVIRYAVSSPDSADIDRPDVLRVRFADIERLMATRG